MRNLMNVLAGLLLAAALAGCSILPGVPAAPAASATLPPPALAVATIAPSDTVPPAAQDTAVPAPTDTTAPADTAQPADTAAPAPTETLAPTPTQFVPPAATVPSGDRIMFDVGSTVAVAQGNLAAGTKHTYIIGAQKGQPMVLNVSSPNNAMSLAVTAPGGAQLLGASAGQAYWQTRLPATGDYVVVVNSNSAAGAYTLTISIAARIKFAAGAVQSVITSKTFAGFVAQYVVYALKGQTMSLTLTGVGADGVLTLSGFDDGQPYLRYVTERTDFSMQLPASEDYLIGVMPRAGAVVPFTLTVNIK
jgi:hypothetical protein